jgi:predicted DNA-binding transcriptional regulator AlpA
MSAERPLPGWPRGLREDLAAEYIGLSVSSIRTLRHRGQFPAPIPLTKGRLSIGAEY